MEGLKVALHAIPILIQKIPMALFYPALTMVLGSALGLLLLCGRLSRSGILRKICGIYISYMRGTPMVVQLFIMYFGLPVLLGLFGIDANSWNPIVFAIIAFVLNMSAFLSEIFRSAYLSVDKGQIEAGYSIGMPKTQVFMHIIAPQALLTALPNLNNLNIDMIKNLSFAFCIGVVDLLGRANQLASASFGVGQVEIYITTAFIYFLLCLLCGKFYSILEWKLDYRIKKGGNGK